jgi:hypothetical protein
MKTVVNRILLTGLLAMGVSGLMAAPASNDWFDQWYKVKFGRPSPAEEARIKADRESTAFRQEASSQVAPSPVSWIEEHFKTKLGRNTPAEEARQNADRETTAFRAEPGRELAPARTRFEEWYRAKYGRYPGK